MPRKAQRIEEWAVETLDRKFLLQAGQGLSVAPKLQAERLIIVHRLGNQFQQADGVKQASGNAPGKRRALTGDDRYSCPQRVGCGGMGVIRQRIEEKIRQAKSREMLLGANARGKNEPI